MLNRASGPKRMSRSYSAIFFNSGSVHTAPPRDIEVDTRAIAAWCGTFHARKKDPGVRRGDQAAENSIRALPLSSPEVRAYQLATVKPTK